MTFVQQQFFPSSDRDELVIDWNLPQNASIADTNAQMARFEREQLQGEWRHRSLVDLCRHRARRGSCCRSTCRRPMRSFGQMIVVTKGGIKGARPASRRNSRHI